MPIIKNNSRQYLFRNKLNKRRKSKKELINESLLMMLVGFFLMLINYLIPKKIELFNSFKENIYEIFNKILEILIHSLEILIVLLISCSILLSLFFFVGSINRIIKILLPKSRKN